MKLLNTCAAFGDTDTIFEAASPEALADEMQALFRIWADELWHFRLCRESDRDAFLSRTIADFREKFIESLVIVE